MSQFTTRSRHVKMEPRNLSRMMLMKESPLMKELMGKDWPSREGALILTSLFSLIERIERPILKLHFVRMRTRISAQKRRLSLKLEAPEESV